MGYFSQRKKQHRESIFLSISLSALLLAVFLSIFSSSGMALFWTDNFLFQLYILNIIIFLFAVFHKKIGFSFLALLILLLIYTNISFSANIFSNTKVEGNGNFAISYENREVEPKEMADSLGEKILHFGKIKLTPRFDADFATIQKGEKHFTLVRVDFSSLPFSEQALLFDNLATFVQQKDEPLIIYGDFGTASWSDYFKDFLHKTSLEVKNRIILDNLSNSFTWFNVPSVNLIAYNNIGIKDIRFTKTSITFDVEYY